MNKKCKVKTSSLTKLLQIGNKTEPEEDDSYDGYFDEKNNYCEDFEYHWYYRLTPWEWVVIPEIVERAKQLGVEVPEDPPFDISHTF